MSDKMIQDLKDNFVKKASAVKKDAADELAQIKADIDGLREERKEDNAALCKTAKADLTSFLDDNKKQLCLILGVVVGSNLLIHSLFYCLHKREARKQEHKHWL